MWWHSNLESFCREVENVVIEKQLHIIAIAVHPAIILEDVVPDDLPCATQSATSITVEENTTCVVVTVVILDRACALVGPIAAKSL